MELSLLLLWTEMTERKREELLGSGWCQRVAIGQRLARLGSVLQAGMEEEQRRTGQALGELDREGRGDFFVDATVRTSRLSLLRPEIEHYHVLKFEGETERERGIEFSSTTYSSLPPIYHPYLVFSLAWFCNVCWELRGEMMLGVFREENEREKFDERFEGEKKVLPH